MACFVGRLICPSGTRAIDLNSFRRYKFNKKTHQVVAYKPQFFRLAERAGDLEIKSVSNKNNKVRRAKPESQLLDT